MTGFHRQGNPGTTPCTAHQRLYIRVLLREHELPVNRVTVMHRDLFKRADIDWCDDAEMDAVLDGCTRRQANQLIDQLRDDSQEEH